MSIISDALKKIQKPEGNRPQLLTPSASPGGRGLKTGLFLLGFALILGFFLKSVFQGKQNAKTSGDRQRISLEPLNLPRQNSRGNPLSQLMNVSGDEFQLTGIALMDGKNFAIINGDIFQEGDQVQGAKLMKVSKDDITLDREGNKIHISLK